ncbi:MAG TPA: peptidoglycan recognition family protein, partial [Phycisphaerales bacterium]|nr:peptidoglycan recognition family protein [Phycisphaerales bacterium]
DPVLQLDVPLKTNSWSGIVIHHLGEPAGDPESINQRHKSLGFDGLAYHFLIGNGNGLGDGVVHVGYRWVEQKPGLKLNAKGVSDSDHLIHICLIGNGDRHEFTTRQVATLTNLVQRLQRSLHIPAGRVMLMRDLSPNVTSPGRFFDEATLAAHLLANP